MDAGKISSFIPTLGLRPADASAGEPSTSRGDAALAAVKIVTAAVLDEVLAASATEPRPPAGGAPQPMPNPRSAVLVTLTASVLAGERNTGVRTAAMVNPPDYSHLKPGMLTASLLLAGDHNAGVLTGAIVNPPDYSQLKPGMPAASLLAGERNAAVLTGAIVYPPDYSQFKPGMPAASPAVHLLAIPRAVEREDALWRAAIPVDGAPAARGVDESREPVVATAIALASTPDPRPEPYPHPANVAAALNQVNAGMVEQKATAAAIAQARDAERLAGLAVKPQTPVATGRVPLGRLIWVALALGVVLLLLF